MQRRVAAIYFVFFLVMGASAYSVIALAEAPAVEVPGDTYSQGDSFTVNGQQYTVTGAALAESEGGGHGGGGGASYVGNLTYTNESFRYTATLANNSNVTYQGDTYQVRVENAEEPDAFTLHQQFNVSGILADDPDVYNSTTTIDGERYVTYRENNTNRLLSEYLPDPDTQQFSTGDTLQYQGNETTVDTVSSSEVVVDWTGANSLEVELTEGSNVTLSGTQYFAHFSGHGDDVEVTLAQSQQAYPTYQNELARQDYFHERMNGLWGVVILAGLAAALIVGLAMMPVKG